MNVPTKDTNPKDAIAVAKAPLHLCSPVAKTHWAMAQFAGMAKYGAWNWRLCGVRASVYLAAMERHMDAFKSGEELDPTDGTHHLGNVMACAAIILDAAAAGMLVDDRPPRLDIRPVYTAAEGLASRLIAQYKDKSPRHATIADVIIPQAPKAPTFGDPVIGLQVMKAHVFQTVAAAKEAGYVVDPLSETEPSAVSYDGPMESVPLTETDPDADPDTEVDSRPPVHVRTGETLPSQPIVDADKPYRVVHYRDGMIEADTPVDDAVDAFRLLQSYQNAASKADILEVRRREGYGWSTLYSVEV